MSGRDVAPFPKSVSRLKIIQAILAIFVLGLTAYLEYYYEGDYRILVPLAISCFTLAIIAFYYVAISCSPRLYSWMLMVLLELIAVVLWIASTVCAALLCKYIVYEWNEYKEYEEEEEHEDDEDDEYHYPRKRDEEYEEFEEFEESGIPFISYVSTSSVVVGLCALQLILYGVTLALMFVHRRRKEVQPTYYGGKAY